jgi:regulatory protein
MSAHEVRTHLRKKGFAPADVAAALKRLEEMGYVDDARLASGFITTRAASKGLGPGRVRGELARRGVARDIVDREMAAAVESGSASLDDASRALERIVRLKGMPADRKERDRVRSALARKGFGASAIAKAMASLKRREAGDES